MNETRKHELMDKYSQRYVGNKGKKLGDQYPWRGNKPGNNLFAFLLISMETDQQKPAAEAKMKLILHFKHNIIKTCEAVTVNHQAFPF
jgi:hypothetical protein